LTRALDRTSIHQTVGFRFSKNIERPHEKFSPTSLIAIGTDSTNEGPSLDGGIVASEAFAPPVRILTGPAPGRAPPAR